MATQGEAEASSLSKLELEESSESIFLLSELKAGTLYLKASDGLRSWEGSIKNHELQTLAKRSKMEVHVYTTETWKALSRQDLGDLSFLYSIKQLEKTKIQLIWKKYIFADNIKFQLGEVILSEMVKGGIHSLLNLAVNSMNDFRESNSQLLAKCDRLSKERQVTLTDLQECADIQDKIENHLFSKFKLVLNEKKAKIRALMKSQENLASENEELRSKVKSCTEASRERSISPSTGCDQATHVSQEISSTPNVDSVQDNQQGSVGTVISLLEDVQCRAPSPPPAKRRRHGNTHKAVANLERPLAKPRVSTHNSTSSTPVDQEEEIESEELLDML